MVEKRENKHAVIYFEPGSAAAMKDLAGQIRGNGGRTTLVWAKLWKGPISIMTEAKAVIVQKDCANEEAIVEAYRKFSHDVEIHYVNQDGVGIDAGEVYEPEPELADSEPVPAEEIGDEAESAAGIADAEEPADDEAVADDGDSSRDEEELGDSAEPDPDRLEG